MASKPKSAESMQRSLAGYAWNMNGEGGKSTLYWYNNVPDMGGFRMMRKSFFTSGDWEVQHQGTSPR